MLENRKPKQKPPTNHPLSISLLIYPNSQHQHCHGCQTGWMLRAQHLLLYSILSGSTHKCHHPASTAPPLTITTQHPCSFISSLVDCPFSCADTFNRFGRHFRNIASPFTESPLFVLITVAPRGSRIKISESNINTIQIPEWNPWLKSISNSLFWLWRNSRKTGRTFTTNTHKINPTHNPIFVQQIQARKFVYMGINRTHIFCTRGICDNFEEPINRFLFRIYFGWTSSHRIVYSRPFIHQRVVYV